MIGYIIHMSQARVRIGTVADTRDASFGPWADVSLSAIWSHYVEALDRAGAAPVIFPVVESYAQSPELALDLVDGLLLTGGVHAGTYGADPDPANDRPDPLRDQVELALGRLAVERRLPVLAVCRGMHVRNVALGGGIDQHLVDPGRHPSRRARNVHQPSRGGHRRHAAAVDRRRRGYRALAPSPGGGAAGGRAARGGARARRS